MYCICESNEYVLFFLFFLQYGVAFIDCRPTTKETPPIRKIHPFKNIDVTLDPVMQFGCP